MSRGSNKKAGPGVADSRLPEPASLPAGLHDRWTVPGICLFLAAITFAVFGQTVRYDFVNYDDSVYVYENTQVARGLTLNGITQAFTHGSYDNWDPLTAISHMLDCQFYGLNAGGHHLTNILLHAATAILLFLILRQMTGALWRSAFVAAVFAIHPLRVESVAWVSERKDVLSGLFFMLTIGAYLRYVHHSWRLSRYLTMVVLFVLGLMSKPMLVTLPFVLLLLDYWPLNRFTRPVLAAGGAGPVDRPGNLSVPPRLIVEKIPLLAFSVALCVATVLVERIGIQPVETYPLPLRMGNALISYVTYMWQMICPAGLAVLYPYPDHGLPVWEIITAILVLLSISAGVFFWRRTRPYLLVGWLWYLGMLVPVIGLIQVGGQAHADRHTYLPQIGLYLGLTWAVADLCAGWRHGRRVLGGLATVILVALILSARAQTSYWRNDESLWTHTLACTSDNFIGHNNLGGALLQKGSVDEAIAHFQKALQIKLDFADAHIYLGNALLQTGSVDEAINHYQRALQIKPDIADAHYNLGNALLQTGSVDEAIAHFQKALQIQPDFADAHNNLGNALLQKGSVDEAINQFQEAIRLKPDYTGAHNNLGNALIEKGSVDEAISQFQEAIRRKPDYADAYYNLGIVLSARGRLDEAIQNFRQALQLNSNRPEAFFHLGMTLDQSGRPREAVAQYRQALTLNPDLVEALNNLAWILAASPDDQLRNGTEAVPLAERACELTHYGKPLLIGTLAAAYAEAGRFPEAVATAEKAEQLATSAGLTAVAAKNRQLLELYRAGKPFHESPPAASSSPQTPSPRRTNRPGLPVEKAR